MYDDVNEDINLADALAEALREDLAEIQAKDPASDYAHAQIDYYEDVVDAVDDSGHNPIVDELLKEVARSYGLSWSDEERIEPLPDSEYMLGVCVAWGLALGYSQGIAKGAEIVIEMFDELPGVEADVTLD